MDKSNPSRRRRSQRDYTLAFKLAIVEQVEKGEFTPAEAQRRYGIQGHSTVLVWLRKHGSLKWSLPKGSSMAKSTETPEQKIKRLEQELQDERDRVLLLNEMIDVADQYYGTSIRKKLSSGERGNSKRKES